MKNETPSSLQEIAKALVAEGKGILAADESPKTCKSRFDALGIPDTEEMRRQWRELLFTTPEVENALSGIILYDETLRQKTSDGTPFPELLRNRGIIPGIKVDKGPVDFAQHPDEKVTEGLDGLMPRLLEYANMGAKFTKWRAVIAIGESIPSDACMQANASLLALFALKSQKAGMVPIVEPEVLLQGTHDLHESASVLTRTLDILFLTLAKYDVDLSGLILKSSMALPGKDSGKKASSDEIASSTVSAFTATVPKDVAGIVFLSGGQTPSEATVRLNAIAKLTDLRKKPWPVTFSYSRALQEPVLAAWGGKKENVGKAQAIFIKRVQETALASRGQFNG